MSTEEDRDAFHGRLGFGHRPAVLIVDMCQAYFTSTSALNTGRPEVVASCRELVGVARQIGVPVWWTRVVIPEDSTSVFRRKVPALAAFSPSNPLADWLPNLAPRPGEPVVTKAGASSFFGTDLAEQMSERRIDTVCVGGVSTSGCVRATVVDICQYDLIPVVVAEACGDRSREAHRQALTDVDAEYGDVVSLRRVVDELRARTGTG